MRSLHILFVSQYIRAGLEAGRILMGIGLRTYVPFQVILHCNTLASGLWLYVKICMFNNFLGGKACQKYKLYCAIDGKII